MNLNLRHSYPYALLRGRITQPITFSPPNQDPVLLLEGHWLLNSYDFYVALDYCLTNQYFGTLKAVETLRATPKQQLQELKTQEVIKLLERWLLLVKKMQFYSLEYDLHDLFYHESGLLDLITHGDMHCLHLISQIAKYRIKHNEEALSLTDLGKEQVEIVLRDVSLKMSSHILSQLKAEMYCPSRQLAAKLLKFYGITYNFECSFQENYSHTLSEKKIDNQITSRQTLIILFTMKVIVSLQELEGVCHYICYLKNILLDKNNGILTADYETWALVYEICLKLYSRNEVVRLKQWIQIDQILSSQIADSEFQLFMIRNCLNESVTLSSINFYIKNSRKEDKEELKPHILNKINNLIDSPNMWKYIEDIHEYIESELAQDNKQHLLTKIVTRVVLLINEHPAEKEVYEIEYGLTFILQNSGKYLHLFDQLLSSKWLAKAKILVEGSNEKTYSIKVLLCFRLFNQFLDNIYTEANYESWNCPDMKQVLHFIDLLFCHNYVCSKAVFKLIYFKLSSEENNEQQWDKFFQLLTEHFFTGGYQDNSDLELIHSHDKYREAIASKILAYFQIMIPSQINERKQLIKCLEWTGDSLLKGSYFALRAFKDGLLFESIQNICLLFNSHLSMQTLEFGLNYCTPFAPLTPWQVEEEEISVLSLICEEMPIETLKFIYKQFVSHFDFDYDFLQQLSSHFWSAYWLDCRMDRMIGFEKVTIEQFDALQKLRRFQFILNLSCCVFDKLNQNSQKNIKQIKIIYENGAEQIKDTIGKLRENFFDAMCLQMGSRISSMLPEEVKTMTLNQHSSIILHNYIHTNSLLYIAGEFNRIGVINQHGHLQQVQDTILPCFLSASKQKKELKYEILYEQLLLCLNLETTWFHKLMDASDENLTHIRACPPVITKEWVKETINNIKRLHSSLAKITPSSTIDNWAVLQQRINEHIKGLIGKIMLPEMLTLLLTSESRPQLSRSLYMVMRWGVELVNLTDTQYEQHFIILIQKLQQLIRDSKGTNIHSSSILCLMQLFFELIFNRIRIRSYHLYRIIKYYQKTTGESVQQFNCIIAQHIRLLFEEFITNYKNIPQIQQLCGSRKVISTSYQKFNRTSHSLNYIEAACTLSMFINLFCRLNYSSLAVGIERIFGDQEAKAIYIDYLNALTRKIVTQEMEISQRDREILKVDVYGNLSIISQGTLSERLLNKLVSLAKNLLRVKIDLKGVNKLPIKLLAAKIATEQLDVNLQEFEDECKAISLGAISLHKKLGAYVNSNLHLCNIYFVVGDNMKKYVQLNQSMLAHNKKELVSQIVKIGREGVAALRICIGEEMRGMLQGLVRKMEKYYQISLRDSQYVQKLYSIFKIICITCLNTPEIIPILLSHTVHVDKEIITFQKFTFLTLKICLPLFCEFYTTLLKTNCGFRTISQDLVISANLQIQIEFRTKILQLFRQEIVGNKTEYPFLIKAICYIQEYSEASRFRFYKFGKNSNEAYESILKEYEKEFNHHIISICQMFIDDKTEKNASQCREIYYLLEITMEKYYRHNSQLDCKKINTEDHIKKMYCPDSDVEGSKQNVAQQKRGKSGQSSRHKVESHLYMPLITEILQINARKGQKQESEHISTRGKKLKDLKQMKLNYIQEDIIGVNDSKQLCLQWNATAGSINSIIVERLKLFTQEIENKQFMKDLSVVFHSKNGVELLPPIDLLHQLGGIVQEATSFRDNMGNLGAADGIIESSNNVQEELTCDELANFSNKIIEECLPIVEMINQNESGTLGRDSDSVIYSQIEIEKGEDGSMKLFGEEEDCPNQGEQIRQEVTKNDIISLIEDCALNPEAKKQIGFSIKYVATPELTKLFAQQSGEIAFIIEGELKNRGVTLFESKPNEYEEYFMDESKIYQRLRWNRLLEDTQILIPCLSRGFVKLWLEILLRMVGQQHLSVESKHTSNFCKRILLQLKNIEIVAEECLALLQTSSNDFQMKYSELLPFNKKFTAQIYKQYIVDEIFGLMVQHRIGLPIVFYASCNAEGKLSKDESEGSTRVIEILLQTVLNSNVPQSMLAKNILSYTHTLGKVTKYQYPYYDIQDCLTFQQQFIDNISERLHLSHQTFGENDKRFSIFKIMMYLDVNCFREFLKIELSKFAEVIRKVYIREDNVLQVFRKNYCGDEGVELERKAEIYWQMRKSKNADQFTNQLIFCRRLLTEIGSVVLEQLKKNCFAMYYKDEDVKMKEEIAYLRRKLPQTRNYSEKSKLDIELKQKQKRYTFWRKNLINLLVTEEVIPALEEVAVQFLEELGKAANLFTDIYSIFHQIINTTPIIFKQAAEFYKLMLAFEHIKREEEQTYHCMSILKTLPSIQSTREMAGRRKRSRLIQTKFGIFQSHVCDLTSIIKKSGQKFTVDSLFMEQGDVLFGMHAKNADTETKVRYLKQENKLGQKVIEVSRENMWADTFPHLDQNFGDYNVKIKIKGEMGLDYGGITREWVTLLAKEVMDPKLGLFQLNANQLAFQPSKFSYLVPNHLQIFKRFGIFVGKAMKENWLLEINFTKSFLKHMLGALLYVEDLEDIEPDTAKGLLWILKNYVDEDLCLNFTYEEQMFQVKRVVELVPAGAEVLVHEANKKDYVKKLAYTKMTQNIREQSLAFIQGIEQVIPIHVLKLFNYREIGKILAGASVINITQMKRYAKYEGYTEDSQNVQWFWEVMQKRSEEDKAEFLFFLTGSYKVPYSGFKDNPITINRMPACKDYCPVAHTCFSIIDLPEYSSLQKLDQMLQLAVKEGKGFTVS